MSMRGWGASCASCEERMAGAGAEGRRWAMNSSMERIWPASGLDMVDVSTSILRLFAVVVVSPGVLDGGQFD